MDLISTVATYTPEAFPSERIVYQPSALDA